MMILAGGSAAAAPAGTLLLRTVAQEANTLKFDPRDPEAPGFSVEVVRELERSDPGLRFEGLADYVPTRRIEAALKAHEIDVFFGLIRTPERLQVMNFVDAVPLYTQYGQFAVRRTDLIELTTLDEVRSLGPEGVIGVPQGSAFVDYLKKQGGLTVDDGVVSVVATLRKLLAGRVRLVYFGGAVLANYLADEGLDTQIRILPTRFNTEGVYVVTDKALEPAKAQRLSAALARLQDSGFLTRLRLKYKVN